MTVIFLFNNSVYLVWLCWIFAAQTFSLVAASSGYSLVAVHGLIVVASLVAEQCLGHVGFGSCGTQA